MAIIRTFYAIRLDSIDRAWGTEWSWTIHREHDGIERQVAESQREYDKACFALADAERCMANHKAADLVVA